MAAFCVGWCLFANRDGNPASRVVIWATTFHSVKSVKPIGRNEHVIGRNEHVIGRDEHM